jgi:hypothetical protein
MATCRELFGFREYRYLYGGQLLSYAGDQLGAVATTVLVFDRTGSNLLAATAYAASWLPGVFCSSAGDDVGGAVECPVAASVEPVASDLAAGGLDRPGAGEPGEGGVVAAASGVEERHDGLGGADRADAGAAGQPGSQLAAPARGGGSRAWRTAGARLPSRGWWRRAGWPGWCR